MRRSTITLAFTSLALLIGGLPAMAQPSYQIIAVTLPGQSSSNVQGVSPDGQFAIGFSNAPSSTAVYWTPGGGTVALPGVPGRAFQNPQGINNSGAGVGIGATTAFGSSPLGGYWDAPAGTSAALPTVAGTTLGRAYGINNSGMMVGSGNGGSLERAAQYTTGSASYFTQTFADGGILNVAYAVTGSGRVVGSGLDPNNAAVTRGFYFNPGDANATNIGALTGLGHNSAIAFDAEGAFIVGTSSLNSGSGSTPFIYEVGGGMTAIPYVGGATTGSARGVNASGWAVGNMSSATSIPFLFDGAQSWRLQDLLSNPAGWDLVGGTSNAAFAIADNGTIVGRGLLNGQVTGFVMVQTVPEPGFAGLLALSAGIIAAGRRRRIG